MKRVTLALVLLTGTLAIARGADTTASVTVSAEVARACVVSSAADARVNVLCGTGVSPARVSYDSRSAEVDF